MTTGNDMTTAMAAPLPKPVTAPSPGRLALDKLVKDKRALGSALILALLGLAVFIGPFFLPDFEKQVLESQLATPSPAHWMGTDHLGRDLFARVLKGGQLSLAIGLIGTLISVLIGTLYGCISGFFHEKLDLAMMRVVDILYSLPYMFLVIILIFQFGKNLYVLFIALGLVQWLTVARIVRGQVLSLKREEFILAARTLGVGSFRIILRHIVPNVMGVVIVYATLTVPSVILQEAFLSFLGLNVSNCTWGVLIADGKDYMDSAWWLLLFPGLILTICLLCMNFLGDSLRDALDPTSKLN
ncbi:MAG: binding-protein-dependent transport system inner rane component [Fibrobacteres bacterium]|nr:binding-protein-dependent transport system inner rane component [Fibrobacterota bacterium]